MAEKKVEAQPQPPLAPPFARRDIPPKQTSNTALSLTTSHTSLHNGDIGQQPVLDTASNIPMTPLDSLPTIAGKDKQIYRANDDIKAFLARDLSLKRLNRIHGHLWMAGRPMRAHPLSRYRMMGFDILFTQQLDLHLLKFSNRLMIKPLPEWMLGYEFWEEHICPDRDLHKSACGFLLSYVWLVTTPLDLKLAHDFFLIPSFITWHWWKEFVKELFDHIDMNALDHVNERFHFGDLRLGRINSIYRLRYAHTHFVRGYLYGYNRYVVFFQRKLSWILVVFVFFSLVLSAMQVGTGIKPLSDNDAFLEASYVFVVFSMASVAAVLGFVSVMYLFIFFFNMAAAISHSKKEGLERARLVSERESKKNV